MSDAIGKAAVDLVLAEDQLRVALQTGRYTAAHRDRVTAARAVYDTARRTTGRAAA